MRLYINITIYIILKPLAWETRKSWSYFFLHCQHSRLICDVIIMENHTGHSVILFFPYFNSIQFNNFYCPTLGANFFFLVVSYGKKQDNRTSHTAFHRLFHAWQSVFFIAIGNFPDGKYCSRMVYHWFSEKNTVMMQK